MLIRNITVQDFEKVNELMCEVHDLHVRNRPDLYTAMEEPYPREKFTEDVGKEDVISVLAEENGEVLGICFVSFREKTGMVCRRTAYMEDLCVRENNRARGVGRGLFEHVREEAKRMGAGRLDLMVWGFNETAFAFYEKMGMQVQRYILETEL